MKQDLFLEALRGNSARIPVLAESMIVEQNPGKAVHASSWLDIEEFHDQGHCELILVDSPRPLVEWHWGGENDDQMHPGFTLACWNIKWRGHALQVVKISWDSTCGGLCRFYVVAQSDQVAGDFILDVERSSNNLDDAILVFKNGYWQRSKHLFKAIQSARFDDLVMTDEVAGAIRNDFRQFLKSKNQYKQLGVAWRRGAIFIGPPGNGKTHCVRALVKELAIPVLYVQSLKDQHQTSDQLWSRIFARARKLSPCILVLEDLDSLVSQSNRSFFLNQLDGFERNHGLIVLATTNHSERIDSAILDRPSRFDRKYQFGLPNESLRRAFLKCGKRV